MPPTRRRRAGAGAAAESGDARARAIPRRPTPRPRRSVADASHGRARAARAPRSTGASAPEPAAAAAASSASRRPRRRSCGGGRQSAAPSGRAARDRRSRWRAPGARSTWRWIVESRADADATWRQNFELVDQRQPLDEVYAAIEQLTPRPTRPASARRPVQAHLCHRSGHRAAAIERSRHAVRSRLTAGRRYSTTTSSRCAAARQRSGSAARAGSVRCPDQQVDYHASRSRSRRRGRARRPTAVSDWRWHPPVLIAAAHAAVRSARRADGRLASRRTVAAAVPIDARSHTRSNSCRRSRHGDPPRGRGARFIAADPGRRRSRRAEPAPATARCRSDQPRKPR